MARDAAITVQNVSKNFKLPHEHHSGLKQVILSLGSGDRGYDLQHVLHNVSFEIKRGDFFAIVGRNGSGKSTLLKLLAGIYQPSSGHIGVNGRLVPFIELGVGFNPELTGRENVYLNSALLGFSTKETDAMYDEIVDFAELHQFMDQKLKNYSSGMQVRLAFSIAIRAKSDILLIDEVLAVGDANFQQKCFDYFERLKRTKQTVVFVSHDMSAVRRFCNRALYLKEGKIIHDGTPDDIADIYTQENIERSVETPEESEASWSAKVTAKVSDRTSESIELEFGYQSSGEEELYLGISIQRDGISVAEITSEEKPPLIGTGTVRYVLDTTGLNSGGYLVGVGLFRRSNRELVAANKSKCSFALKGNDPIRGGALKLKDTWELL